MGWFCVTEKIGSKMWSAKYGVQKIGSGLFYIIQKEKRQPGLFSFKLQIASKKNIVQKLKKISGRPDKSDIGVQIDWVPL